MSWLPRGRRAAVCFTIDDVHPGKASYRYDGGGDLGDGVLGHLEWLLAKHPRLRATLFVTADWRTISPMPTRTLLAKIPIVRDRAYLTKVIPRGVMRVDRHPEFVRYLRGLPRTEIALHGLHHIQPGRRPVVEFQGRSAETCRRMLQEALAIFASAGLDVPTGMAPPGWDAPPALLEAMVDLGFDFVASARDITTPVTPGARAQMSGLRDVLLFEPEFIAHRKLVHVPVNFQATSLKERALEIVDMGGLLSIKAHAVTNAMGHISLDGLDALYANYLDALLCLIEDRYGDVIDWTTMGELTRQLRSPIQGPGRV